MTDPRLAHALKASSRARELFAEAERRGITLPPPRYRFDKTVPDIDVDISPSGRDSLFAYLKHRYGHVARIGNLSTMQPRSVLARCGKALGIPEQATRAVRSVLVEYSSGDSRYGRALEDTLQHTDPGQAFMRKHPEMAMVYAAEQSASHTSVHAGGVVVSPTPLTNYATVRDGVLQMEKYGAENLNLLKIDMLGLRTLAVLEELAPPESYYQLPLTDQRAFDVINAGHFSGIFQFEGDAQRRVSAQLHITDFRTMDHITALSRPGPLGGGAANHYINRSRGSEPVTYRHPSMAAYLGDTLGVVLYQEQVMSICREIGGFNWSDITEIRRAMSKRKGEEWFAQWGAKFAAGAARLHGMTREDADAIWDEINSFGSYGMNKCVTANTRIKLCHPNQWLGKNPTIEELYLHYERPGRKGRPAKLLSFDGERAKPAVVKRIHKTGVKRCIELVTADGRSIELTPDHRLLINGQWATAGTAQLGDELTAVSRKRWIKDGPNAGRGKAWRKGRAGAGMYDVGHGRSMFEAAFRRERASDPCDDCGKAKQRMEVHHNDFNHGADRPDDLAWLCSGCHKQRHMDAGNWLTPYARGWTLDHPAIITEIREAGYQETYDIEMAEEPHNFVLANGIVSHNSHTVSYAIISYWCAYQKATQPLEFAAALLRHAKHEEQAVELLRELDEEQLPVVMFDIKRSQPDWSVQDGQLVGGWRNLKGVGPKLAEKYAANPPAELPARHVLRFPSIHATHERWGALYDLSAAQRSAELRWVQRGTPLKAAAAAAAAAPVLQPVRELADLADDEIATVVCLIRRRDRRDENEEVRRKRRGGDFLPGQTKFLDVFVTDDSTKRPVIVRFKSRVWDKYGRRIADHAVDDEDWLLVHGRWLKQFNMLLAARAVCLTKPGLIGNVPNSSRAAPLGAAPEADPRHVHAGGEHRRVGNPGRVDGASGVDRTQGTAPRRAGGNPNPWARNPSR